MTRKKPEVKQAEPLIEDLVADVVTCAAHTVAYSNEALSSCAGGRTLAEAVHALNRALLEASLQDIKDTLR